MRYWTMLVLLFACVNDPAGMEDDGGTRRPRTDGGGRVETDGGVPMPTEDGGIPTSTDDATVPPMGTDAGMSTDPELPGPGSCHGYATRYWDCCKAHCGWSGNVPEGVSPATSCGLDDAPLSDTNVASSCDGSGGSFTCFSMAPRAISDTLSYGYAAVPADGDICGRCYRLDFTGEGHYNAADPGSRALMGRTMIVQATNIGHDVGGGQFDLLIPGGGVGLFNACSRQWGVSDAELGAQYGGLLTACQASHSDHDAVRGCVRDRCHAIFDEPQFAELRAGCDWFVDWYHAADNPNLTFREVACPADLIAESGVDRRPLDDVAGSCGGGGEPETCECDCSWTMGGAACGANDGSCCWRECCGS
ncbi:MAG: hypothetical protein H6721_03785 [Sandaracinus sp.]|nr:hypothetical protein [Sandaracinus sp.]MCB9621436.1 hypothetical protein [Sandaracinus sp.]MCB9631250.1 hypothetical protein [Sandaracinus sp.]